MRMAQADRVTAIVLAVLGLAMLAGGWTMDRLEIRRIHPASIPGLVPMILGALLTLCAGLLWRSARSAEGHGAEPFLSGGSWSRLIATGGICTFYALILIGWLPFFWATALFVAGFGLLFAWPRDAGLRSAGLAIARSAGFGLVVALATALLFEQVFLVRLP